MAYFGAIPTGQRSSVAPGLREWLAPGPGVRWRIKVLAYSGSPSPTCLLTCGFAAGEGRSMAKARRSAVCLRKRRVMPFTCDNGSEMTPAYAARRARQCESAVTSDLA